MGLVTTVAFGMAATVLSSTMVGAPAAATTLTVDAECDAWYGIGPWRDFYCTASASGGSGSFLYTWQPVTPFTIFYSDQGPSSSGYCTSYQDVQVSASASRSSDARAAGSGFPSVVFPGSDDEAADRDEDAGRVEVE
ncbi:hypothetical protein, partial [Micromonospora sonchi]|uniref:hypothetical protein n=1 Tax=Micromonospora sonchi TaxID=1763543 RepID=UPI0016670F60